MGAEHRQELGIHVPAELREIFDSAAEAADLSTGTLLKALALGAIRTGRTRLLLQAVADDPLLRVRTRATPRLPWDVLPTDHKQERRYAYGPWVMRWHSDVGTSAQSKYRQPGDGWRLFGPEMPETGMELAAVKRPQALKEAEGVIRHILAEKPWLTPTS